MCDVSHVCTPNMSKYKAVSVSLSVSKALCVMCDLSHVCTPNVSKYKAVSV